MRNPRKKNAGIEICMENRILLYVNFTIILTIPFNSEYRSDTYSKTPLNATPFSADFTVVLFFRSSFAKRHTPLTAESDSFILGNVPCIDER